MKYKEFEKVISEGRMSRYKAACANDTRKAMMLYRLNLRLSQEIFTVVSCFEVALRNSIDSHYRAILGQEWLRDSVRTKGVFTSSKTYVTAELIRNNIKRLGTAYTHNKLVAEMDFGFWRYLFAQPQFQAAGQSLLHVFPSKPRSAPAFQYNQKYIFNELKKINDLRNRLAHHEPVCFQPGQALIDTTYVRQHYTLIIQFFYWMQINESALLYGLDHIAEVCDKIDAL